MFLAQTLVLFARFFVEIRLQLFIEQRVHNTYRARCVQHVHSAGAIMRRDLARRVGPASRGTPDQKRQAKPFSLHLLRNVHHLIQRRRDQTA